MKVQLGSNFKDQNKINETLGIKVKIQVNFRKVEDQLPKISLRFLGSGS